MPSTRGKKASEDVAEESTGGRRVTRSSIRCAGRAVDKSEEAAAPATPKRKARVPANKVKSHVGRQWSIYLYVDPLVQNELKEVDEERELAVDKPKRTKKRSSCKMPQEESGEVSDVEIVNNQPLDDERDVEVEAPKIGRSPEKVAKEPSPQKVVKVTSSSQKRASAVTPIEEDSDSDSAPEDVGFSAARATALESLALQRTLAKALDKKIKEDRQRMHERNLEQKKRKEEKPDEGSNRQEASRKPKQVCRSCRCKRGCN
jgi:hypothetical protein